ncbi:MAG TPA: type II CAAX endopeptidase family protein [Puia sp.]|nr:type II CAAX endopeptidase family protein [Puia sp.]
MDAENIKRPLIKQGWLRVLLFFIFYFILVAIVSLPIAIFLIRSGEGNVDLSRLSELLNGKWLWLSLVIAAVLSIIAVFLFRKFVDRKSLASLGFDFSGHQSDALSGFFLALAILGVGTVILYFSGHLRWDDISFDGKDLFIQLGMMAIVAFYEELVFRGYILNNLMESFSKWLALIISAALFVLFHLDNPSINIIAIINIFLAGVLLGVNYIYTRNLWFAFLFHFGWNFFEGPVLGYKISGLHSQTLLQTELKGDLLLTGGDFGFEGSIFCLALILIAILLLYWTYEKREQSAKFNIQ